jgi:hypothetical protein
MAQSNDSNTKQIIRAFKYKKTNKILNNKSKLNTLYIDCLLWGSTEFKKILGQKNYAVHVTNPIFDFQKNFSLSSDDIKRLLLLQDFSIQTDMKQYQQLSNSLKSLGELIESYDDKDKDQ